MSNTWDWNQADRATRALETIAEWCAEQSEQGKQNVRDLLNMRDTQLNEAHQQLKEAKDALAKVLDEYEPVREEA